MRGSKAIGLGGLSLLAIGLAWSFDAATPSVGRPEFTQAELGVTTAAVRLGDALPDLPNRSQWEEFAAREGARTRIRIDPRSGRPASIITRVPMAQKETARDRDAVTDLVLRYIRRNRNVFGIDPSHLGAIAATEASPGVWQISIPQQVEQIQVRDARLVANVSRGSLVLFGASHWDDVRTSPRPKIDAEEAIRIGLRSAAGGELLATVREVPRLEFLPVTPPGREKAYERGRKMMGGYAHRLAWIIEFTTGSEDVPWEVAVEAHSGEVLSTRSLLQHANKKVTGNVQSATFPMPWADTGFATPRTNTFSSGVYDYVSGSATTTLTGKYVDVTDTGGLISASSATGDIHLSGSSGGNTPAARTTFYVANRMAEIARGYRPDNTWLNSQVPARTNHINACEASWNGTTILMGRGQDCGNPGEMESAIAHEWGHGFDQNDGTGRDKWTEAYADIAAIYRTHASCLGGGLLTNHPQNDEHCGMNEAELFFLNNESQVEATHCDLSCTGKRDADYATHEGGLPDTVENFVCVYCDQGGGPCQRDEHCGTAPARQAAWDLAARDLQGPPYNYDANTAFNIASRLFYLGSQNVENWHTCDCEVNDESDGCNADSGYLQWLAIDDDDDNLENGTPHMQAIFNAFDRHKIACGDIEPTDSGCAGGPTTAATLTATARCGAVDLSWSSVSNASGYTVFRGEGPNACNLGKALISTQAGTTLQGKNLLNGLQYCYTVMAIGSDSSCIAPASTCTCVTPASNLTDVDTPDVKVTYANGGETLYKTSTINITWDATDSCGIGSTVAIKLSTTGVNGSYSTLFSNQANTGSKSWTVSGSSSLNNAFFKVEATDGNSHTGSDTSDAAFTIRNCGPATVSYCRDAEWRCTFNNTCGPSGCANYSCHEDETCLEAETPPAEACQ